MSWTITIGLEDVVFVVLVVVMVAIWLWVDRLIDDLGRQLDSECLQSTWITSSLNGLSRALTQEGTRSSSSSTVPKTGSHTSGNGNG